MGVKNQTFDDIRVHAFGVDPKHCIGCQHFGCQRHRLRFRDGKLAQSKCVLCKSPAGPARPAQTFRQSRSSLPDVLFVPAVLLEPLAVAPLVVERTWMVVLEQFQVQEQMKN